jgi:hypothetical protein
MLRMVVGRGRALSCSEGLSQPRGTTARYNGYDIQLSDPTCSGEFRDATQCCLLPTRGRNLSKAEISLMDGAAAGPSILNPHEVGRGIV